MIQRRDFLKTGSIFTGSVLLSKPLKSIAGISSHSFFKNRLELNTVPVFHTSGGIQNIHSVLKEKNILLDAGNFLNNKSSLNEHLNLIAAMNNAGYNAINLGSTEVSKGEEYLASLISKINFKLINCNYTFNDPVLKKKISEYHIINYGQYKIGITGVAGKVASISVTAKYHNAYERGNEIADYLKTQKNCDIVICLSDLDFNSKKHQPQNYKLAKNSKNIDVIISSSKRTVPSQIVLRNKLDHEIILSTSVKKEFMLTGLNFTFDKRGAKHSFDCKNYSSVKEIGTPEFKKRIA